jgi:soluble lytic murein transglycosylase-like protein
MLLLLALLAQDPTPLRDKMAAALDKQREAVKRQTRSLGLHQNDQPTGFFTTPWPRTQLPTTTAPAATMQPAAYHYEATRVQPWACDPMDPAALDSLIAQTAAREQLTPDLLLAVIRKESAGYPCAVSNKGASGLMQLMPATARQFAVSDAFDPKQNVEAGARLLKQLIERYPNDLPRALAAYNAGSGAVDQHGGVPPYAETQNYVTQILGWLTGRQDQ